ncbi:phosphoribosyl-AMP cyclohydrolase [Neomoorella thermoacetica]|uniref:phosphoribosyl-AMP cyclohydrolase n=1 Tax=Neomoorella thermoacetica TaxID=1525 RepID=UPI0008FB0BBA|nr:phosphoribosyl-AMP cyclohydrolase [Moorella thermoacetica]OIQ54751.1 phosphoribosyl-ATP pyrophosphatase [Moorella thermoacetica]
MSVTIPEDIHFNAEGLIPAIIQDAASGQVLMLAYMNRESLARSLATGETWFYSRSRRELWHKGATSGHRQYIESASYDCDADALLFKVRQVGVACHEGEFSCFHNPLPLQVSRPRETGAGGDAQAAGAPRGAAFPLPEGVGKAANKGEAGRVVTTTAGEQQEAGSYCDHTSGQEKQGRREGNTSSQVNADLGTILSQVFQVIKERQATRPEGSYTAYLFNNGQDKILKKIGEEAGETIIASKNDSPHEILYEMADLYYHTLVLLAYHGLEPEQLAAELAARR